MSSTFKILIALAFCSFLVYMITESDVLQRVSFDIYECKHRLAGETKLWFKNIQIGEKFEFTWNSDVTLVPIDDIFDGKISFVANEVYFKLDPSSLKLVKEELGSVMFFNCELNSFRM